MECTTSYSGCMETKFVACPPVTLLRLSFVKPAPWVTAGFLSSIPNAPISSSSDCDVARVLPEFSVVPVPVPVWTLSAGDGDTSPLKEKNVAAMLTLVAGDVATVIVPLANEVVIGAEKTSVLTPLVPPHGEVHADP